MLTQYRCDNTHRPLPHPAAATTLMPLPCCPLYCSAFAASSQPTTHPCSPSPGGSRRSSPARPRAGLL